MAIIKCENGHFYDNEKNSFCPICSKLNESQEARAAEEKTVSLDMLEQQKMERIVMSRSSPAVRTSGTWDNERTIAFYENGEEVQPLLVGWLVCTKGPMRGRDFRMYPGFNRIARRVSADVCLDDDTISRDIHCSIAYDQMSDTFFLVPGHGTLTYVEDKTVEEPMELASGTRFRLGNSELELVVFCKGEHTWEKL
jgi:hypothetical protein